MQLGLTAAPVVITGAASGIGAACARAFGAEGATLGLIDHNAHALAALADELAERSVPVEISVADVTDEAQMKVALEGLSDRLGGIRVAVACAGISGPFGVDVDKISITDWERVLAVNVTGQFLLVKHALPALRRSTDASVVLIASDSGFAAAPGMVPYNASKGAVVQLTRALSVDLAVDGVRVNCVCPSIVDTPMARADLGVEEGEFGGMGYPVQTAAEVANHVLYLSSPISRPVNGTALISDFGYLARSSFPA